MKILYMLDVANLNGSELHLLDLAKYASCKADVTVMSLKSGPLNDRLLEFGIKQIQFDVSWIGVLKNFFFILDAIRIINPDIIHSHQPKAVFYGGVFSKLLRIPEVVTIHSKPIDNLISHKIPRNWFVYLGHVAINLISQVLATKIIFVNRIMYKESFFQYKSMCIYNWLSPIHEVDECRKTLKHTIRILSVGSISLGKGTDLLLDLFELIKHDQRYRKFSFILDVVGTGDGTFVEGMVRKVRDKSLENVNFLGYQNSTSDYYKQATIFILLSRSETFGLVYVEAMNYGLPVFSLNLDVLKEIVPEWNCKSNDLVELKEGIFNLISSADLYERVSKKNLEYVLSKFSYKKSMQETYSLYQELQ